MVKFILIFLLILVAISMIGNLFRPGGLFGAAKPPAKLPATATCGHCGRAVVGTAPCICGQG